VSQKNFREDLFFRLNGFSIKAPALRQHLDDLPLLAEHFLELFKSTNPQKSSVGSFSTECIKAMQTYPWPGNVRELRNAVDRAVILTTGAAIEPHNLPENIHQGNSNSLSGAELFVISSMDGLPTDPSSWPHTRLLAEIHLCLEAKRRIKSYKGKYWKAEFMRLMFPECKASNAKGFDDFIRRLTKSPWGNSRWGSDSIEIRSLIE
jgi:DNA-binding NtrC family response regulator